MSPLIISVSGLRGIVGEALTPDVACRFAACFAASLPDGPVVIGRDGRVTGRMLRDAVTAGLTACGHDVVDADVAATPTIGVLVKQFGAAGGVQISASHNPPPYNGLKLFGRDGRVLDATSGAAIRDRYLNDQFRWASFDTLGSVTSCHDPHGPHLERVLQTVDAAAIASQRYAVLLDSNFGAGGQLGIRLLEALGCRVELVGGEPTGQFAHPPEPTAENLESVGRLVAASDATIGFCQDPDADRLALIDENGRYIGEEATLALCVQRAMEVGRTDGPIVINGATSSMSAEIARRHGVECFRSAVGEANVADAMIQNHAVYGGEGSGGPIDPNVGYVRDSFVGIAAVLDLMTRTGKPLSQLADELPVLHIFKDKAAVDAANLPAVFATLQSHFADADATHGDGLRLAWPDKWLLVRGSNTEPIVRMIAEANEPAVAADLCETAKRLLS